MINAIGLQNIGVEAFCIEALPVLRERGAVVAVNVFGERMEEYVEVIERCEREEGIAAYELNVSCPNVTAGGIEFGHDPAQLERLTRMGRAATRRVLWVKLSPNAPDLVGTARAAVDGGADGLTLINTLRAMAIDAEKRRPVLARGCGGLSGPAIKPIALRMVWEVHRALPSVPLVGIGGVETGRDVVEFLLAGASAVQVGTAIFRDPAAPVRILGELERFCAEHGIAEVRELVGALEWH
jgi:dihydroorotate dehydrogenase (NAD+) catalytic subunit